MPVDTKIELVGVEQAIKSLRKIDPELRKQFNRDAKEIARPVFEEAARNYPELPLSGMARAWKNILPWDVRKARRGLRVKIDTSRKSTNVIVLMNTDKAAAVFEQVGRRTDDPLAQALGPLGAQRTRVLGPALDQRQDDVVRGFEALARATMRTVQKELK